MELNIIGQKIFEIRGQKIMLDFDLAELYETETKYLKRTVRQNLKRFPTDFMFELTEDEWEFLRCNFSTSKNVPDKTSGRGGIRYLPPMLLLNKGLQCYPVYLEVIRPLM